MKQKLINAPETATGAKLTNLEVLDTAEQLAQRIQVCVGTIANWRKSGKLPFIKTPGRSIRFYWPDVKQALLRMQRK
jgi:excisionase family DNA binding protein